MNCSEFEACLVDLVTDRTSAALVRAEAQSHASSCSRCAARLAEEQGLVAGLTAWANRAQQETAPAHVEAALLTRFRQIERVTAVVPDIRSPKRAWWKTPGYVGFAASALLLLGWALIQFTRNTDVEQAQRQPSPKLSTSSEQTVAAPGKIPSQGGVAAGVDGVGPQPGTTHPEGAALLPPELGITLKKRSGPSAEPVRKPVRSVKPRPPQVSTPVTEGRSEYAARSAGPAERRPVEAERMAANCIETEFIPFMAAGPRFASEQRQFVRVKLPRSALQVFGLPMNMERAREPIQADVMLGEDGRALAVRFVRE
ncbi:MAG TPA: hypothetical protein VFJ27_02860 [Terriglobia bacterium]|nr:hypothetical protein [Terriglobia bacterium]